MTTYQSTRGGVRNAGFEEIVLSGLANDKGLFVPEQMPSIPKHALKEWRGLSYQALALEIMSLLIDEKEIPRKDLKNIIDIQIAPKITKTMPILKSDTFILARMENTLLIK